MLYRPEQHEELTKRPWRKGWVRSAIEEIAADAEAAFSPDALWPADEWDAWGSPTPLKNLYVGATGVVWALGALRRRAGVDGSLDLGEAALAALAAWRAEPDFQADTDLPAPAEASLLCGETGPLVVAYQVRPDASLAADLFAHVAGNTLNEANELMWGSPGTMLAAWAMDEWTGEERWAGVWTDSAEALWAARDDEGLWTQRLYGDEVRSLTPPHGLVGNTRALLQGDLAPEQRQTLERETAAVLQEAAVIQDGLANWPPRAGGGLVGGDGQIRVQWCAGAPGIVTGAAGYLDEALVLAGAELTCRAGPHGLEKGPGICHGTSGNGYALLKTFERTGDEVWLERARRFAVHALEQVARLRVQRGRGRYSLFTGDIGTALFAADCTDGAARYPILDGWD